MTKDSTSTHLQHGFFLAGYHFSDIYHHIRQYTSTVRFHCLLCPFQPQWHPMKLRLDALTRPPSG
jgi:hypothetical protein